jgi:hypothetical protein
VILAVESVRNTAAQALVNASSSPNVNLFVEILSTQGAKPRFSAFFIYTLTNSGVFQVDVSREATLQIARKMLEDTDTNPIEDEFREEIGKYGRLFRFQIP